MTTVPTALITWVDSHPREEVIDDHGFMLKIAKWNERVGDLKGAPLVSEDGGTELALGRPGLNYEWSATADWRRELAVDMARATFEGQQESAAQAQARDSAIDSLVALLMNSPEFRAAMPTKRIPTALALLASQQNANEDAIRQATSRASTNLARRVLEIEILLKPKLDELAEELRHTPDWRVATSIPKRHEAAVTFLMEKAEGFRLSSGISDPLMRAAKQLEDSTASRKDT